MRSSRTRSLLVSAFVLALAGVGWFFLAPTQIGGSTRYVITHGISMEPLIHTGDLVLVRPASDYHVGEVVAYHSTLLKTVVLHRIIAIHDGHYTFKGDNNSFLDPTHPTRALLLGRMWLHIPHGGTVLDWVHKPWVAALLTGGVAMLLLLGGDQQRRRRRGGQQRQGGGPTRPTEAPSYVANRVLLVVSVVGAMLFAALGVFALVRPTSGSSGGSTAYTQQLSFGYRGPAKPGSVYPSGTVTTGDPVYLQLVHQLAVTASYELKSAAPTQVHGTLRIHGTLSNSSGWSRGFWLSPRTAFSGNRGSATAQLNLSGLQALTGRVSSQIGAGIGGYTLVIAPQVKLSGTIGGAPLTAVDSAALDLTLGASSLASGTSAIASSASSTGAPGTGSAQSGFVHTTPGTLLSSSGTATKELGGVPVRTVRWIALAGFILLALVALLTGSRELRGSSDPVEQINHRYKHLIVPVSSITPDAGHPPIEVRTIEALAQLAERSERLILHDHQDNVDNYLIDDQGTMFRFQALRIPDTNGNGHGNGKGNGNGKGGTEHATAGVPARAASAAAAAPAATAADPASVAGAAIGAEAEHTSHRGAPIAAKEPAAAVRTAPLTAEHAPASPAAFVNGMAPLSDPAESAQAIRLSGRVIPDLMGFGPEPRRPPIQSSPHWTDRPEVRRVGFTLGPLLTFLAWRHMRSKRADRRPAEFDDQTFAQPDRMRNAEPQPQRGPGDRRAGERRRN